ncbi:MAG: hypothetical protein WBE20_16200 [Candidatus Acidiferrales bacterium]
MKTMRNVVIAFALTLLCAPMISAQDLSKYRNFSLGASLDVISRLVKASPDNISVIHQTPAVIQELTWSPVQYGDLSVIPESVQQIRFSFYNRELHRMTVMYEDGATEGLTADDMIAAISAKYGAATRPDASGNTVTNSSYSSTDIQIGLWENPQYSVTLSRFPLSNSYQLVMVSRQLNDQAGAAIATARTQDREDAPQKEMARVKKAAADMETKRQANLKTFRP